MRKDILFGVKSQYREQLNVYGFRFGHGRRSAAIVGAMRGNEVQQMYVCGRGIRELKKLKSAGMIAPDCEFVLKLSDDRCLSCIVVSLNFFSLFNLYIVFVLCIRLNFQVSSVRKKLLIPDFSFTTVNEKLG